MTKKTIERCVVLSLFKLRYEIAFKYARENGVDIQKCLVCKGYDTNCKGYVRGKEDEKYIKIIEGFLK